jgi:hypothetical protein
LTIHYIGSFVNNEPDTVAGVAGQKAQKEIIDRLNDRERVQIFSYVPRMVFPKATRLVNGYYSTQYNNIYITKGFYINFPVLKWVSLNLSLIFYLILNVNKNDLVVSYNYSYPSGWPVYLAKKIIGFKDCLIAFDINIPGETVTKSFFHLMNYWSYKYLIPRVDKLVAITPNIVSDFLGENRHNAIVVEGGVSSYRKGNYKNKEIMKIGYAGSLYDYNLIEETLLAVKTLSHICELHILGDGPLKKIVMDAAINNENITFYGQISHGECLKVLASCDVLLCLRSSRKIRTNYLFPSKYLEYIALGKIVLSTKLPLENLKLKYSNVGESSSEIKEAIISLKNEDDKEISRYFEDSFIFIKSKCWSVQVQRMHSFMRE